MTSYYPEYTMGRRGKFVYTSATSAYETCKVGYDSSTLLLLFLLPRWAHGDVKVDYLSDQFYATAKTHAPKCAADAASHAYIRGERRGAALCANEVDVMIQLTHTSRHLSTHPHPTIPLVFPLIIEGNAHLWNGSAMKRVDGPLKSEDAMKRICGYDNYVHYAAADHALAEAVGDNQVTHVLVSSRVVGGGVTLTSPNYET